MKLHKIRNATIIIEYAGKRFLINPAFAPKAEKPSVAINNLSLHNLPTHNLPLPPKDIVKNIDAVIITSIDLYHFDKIAENIIPKTTKIFVLNEIDKAILVKAHFKNIEILSSKVFDYEGINLCKAKTNGAVMYTKTEPSLCLSENAVLHEGIIDDIEMFKPDYIIINSAFVKPDNNEIITMKLEDIKELHKYYPEGKLIINRIDNVESAQLRNGSIGDNVYIPTNGEVMFLQ